MARASAVAASAATRRAPWIWIGAAAAVSVAALVLVYLFTGLSGGGERISGAGVSFTAPAGWTAAPAPEEGVAAWAFARPVPEDGGEGEGYATLAVVVRALPGGLSARGFAGQHGGEPTSRPVADTSAWETARLELGAYERSAFVPLPDGVSVAEVRLVAGPVPGWEEMEPADAEASLGEAIAAYDAVLDTLELAE